MTRSVPLNAAARLPIAPPRPRPGILIAVVLAVGGCTSSDTEVSSGPRFTLLDPSATGVTFANVVPENPVMNGFTYEYYYNGGGVAAGDLDGDGLADLFFTSNIQGNRLYLNRGEMRFEDVTTPAGVRGRAGGWATGVSFADVNADRRLDIYVSYSGPFDDPDRRRNVLYINKGVRDGVPVFTDEAASYGLDDPAYSTQAAFFDYDGDGDLDAYLLNHPPNPNRSPTEGGVAQSPHEADRLYRNDSGKFVDASAEAGLVDTDLGFGLGVSVADVNNDGRPDIYVANDYAGRDFLYLGGHNGRFNEVLTQSMGHIPFASMGSDIADIDGDGWSDLAVAEMAMDTHYDRKTSESGTEAERFARAARAGQHYQYAANALQWNRGVRDGAVPIFSEIANLAGIARTDWSWATLFADLDNSGRPDLFITTGIAGNYIDVDYNDYRHRRVGRVMASGGRVTPTLVRELLDNLPRRKVPNRAFRNEDGVTFSDRTTEWGLHALSYSNGAVYVDLDRDGALDLVTNNLMAGAFIYRNRSRQLDSGHYLAIQLDGAPNNRFGIGARVRLTAGGNQQWQELQLTRGYQSSVEPVLHFGLGMSEVVDTLEVAWPDGSREVRTGVLADRYLTLAHTDARPRAGSEPDRPVARHERTVLSANDTGPAVSRSGPLFEDASAAMRPVPRHVAAVSVMDSALQPYPSRRDGIALAVGDLNGDGLDDFIYGGESARVYLQHETGTFRSATTLTADDPTEQTMAAAIFDADGDDRNDIWLVRKENLGRARRICRHQLLLGRGERGFVEASGAVRDLADATDGESQAPSRPALQRTNCGGVVLAAGDYDGDRQVDLFVGNRSVPGSDAGALPGSRLLRNERGVFRDVTDEAAPALVELRTVTDARWADVDADQIPDLLVAGEWMPITLLRNDGRRLRDGTIEAGLGELTGWWQSIAAADLDGDGDVDVIAGNMGLNYPYRPTAGAPFELYVHDFAGNGRVMTVPAYHEDGELYPWFGRTRLAWELPELLVRFPTHSEFARATLVEVVGGERLRSAQRYEASTLASTVLVNDGDGRFRPRPLPLPAQVSPATGIVAADFDGDGILDIVLAGNIPELDVSVPKADAGIGLFLRGVGGGKLQPVMPAESGLRLKGSVRRLAPVRVGRIGALGLVAAVVDGVAVHVRVRPVSQP